MTVQRCQGEIFISDLTDDGKIPVPLYWQKRGNIFERGSVNRPNRYKELVL